MSRDVSSICEDKESSSSPSSSLSTMSVERTYPEPGGAKMCSKVDDGDMMWALGR